MAVYGYVLNNMHSHKISVFQSLDLPLIHMEITFWAVARTLFVFVAMMFLLIRIMFRPPIRKLLELPAMHSVSSAGCVFFPLVVETLGL